MVSLILLQIIKHNKLQFKYLKVRLTFVSWWMKFRPAEVPWGTWQDAKGLQDDAGYQQMVAAHLNHGRSCCLGGRRHGGAGVLWVVGEPEHIKFFWQQNLDEAGLRWHQIGHKSKWIGVIEKSRSSVTFEIGLVDRKRSSFFPVCGRVNASVTKATCTLYRM